MMASREAMQEKILTEKEIKQINFNRRLRWLLVNHPNAVYDLLIESFHLDGSPTGKGLTKEGGAKFNKFTAHTMDMVIPRVLVAEKMVKEVEGRYILTNRGIGLMKKWAEGQHEHS